MTPTLKARRLDDRDLVNGRWIARNAPHGTWGGYTNWFCRCDPCRAANTRGMRTYIERTTR